jgi:hypothetical protein
VDAERARPESECTWRGDGGEKAENDDDDDADGRPDARDELERCTEERIKTGKSATMLLEEGGKNGGRSMQREDDRTMNDGMRNMQSGEEENAAIQVESQETPRGYRG